MLERVINGYLKSPVREAPNQKIVEGFWSNRSLQQLPYQRGALLALNWNAEIKKSSSGEHSLADVIAELADQAHESPVIMLTPSRIAEAARTLGVTNAAGDIAGFIDTGRLLTPHEDVFGPCADYDKAKSALVPSAGGWESAACAAWLK
jgi:predicted metalloprotease with PDZ domain